MAINKVVKNNLESVAIDMRGEGKNHGDISKELSKVAKTSISQNSVQRFFATYDKEKAMAVEKSNKLQAKVAEAEINTIDEAMGCVNKLKEICEKAIKQGDNRTAIMAVREIYTGLDIVNKVLGKYQTANVQINLNQVNIDGEKRALLERIAAIPATEATFENIM